MSNPIRPRLRPTLSRKVKYIGIAPSAQKKLGREARRGSHDLRKLVGHANFLDVLIEQLDVGQEECEDNAVAEPEAIEPETSSRVEEEEEQLDDEEDSDDWTSEEDESDDEDHMLFRPSTVGRSTGNNSDVHDEIPLSPDEDGDDYFSRSRHGEAVVRREEDLLTIPRNLLVDDKDGTINVVVTSSLAEPMDELRNGMDDATAIPLTEGLG